MSKYKEPTLEEFTEYVKKYPKSIGCRYLYRDFDVPDEKKAKFRDAWDLIAKDIEQEGVSDGIGSDNKN